LGAALVERSRANDDGPICSAPKEVAMSVNTDAVNQVYDVFSKGNLDEFDAFVADDFIEHEDLMGMPMNRDGVKQFFVILRSAFPDLSMRATHLVEEGDLVAARFEAHGTQTGEFAGVAPSGRSFTVSGFDLVRMTDGRMHEHWGSFDAIAMCQQLGIDPAQLMPHPG
jgi:steroid delta-isomerase-like uncharacterized protein